MLRLQYHICYVCCIETPRLASGKTGMLSIFGPFDSCVLGATCHISLFVTGKNHLGNSKSNCQPPELLEYHGTLNEHLSSIVQFGFVDYW